jgi:hypothetical protein
MSFSQYESLLGQKAGAFGRVDPEKVSVAETKKSALEQVKMFGEVKTYLSGKPILQKVLSNLGKTKVEDLGRLGVNTEELSANYNAALASAGREAQSILQSAKSSVASSVPEEQTAVRQTAQDIIGDADPEDFLSFGTARLSSAVPSLSSMSRVASASGQGAISRPITRVSEDLNENLAETTFDTAPRTTIGNAVGRAGNFAKATESGATAGATAGEETTEAVASILDGIPGAEVIGAIAGIGATLYGALHKVKEPKPADDIHIAPTSGVE